MKVTTIKNIVLQSCSYILWNENYKEVYIIDCGEVEPILQFVKQNNKKIAGVFLTHGHYDHVYGLKKLISNISNIKIYGTTEALDALSDSDRNMSYMYDIEEEYEIRPSDINRMDLTSQCLISILDTTVECICTPGHDVGCMTYLIGRNIFTGDSYNPDFEVFAKWNTSNQEQAVYNECFLRDLVEKQMLNVYPGHYK